MQTTFTTTRGTTLTLTAARGQEKGALRFQDGTEIELPLLPDHYGSVILMSELMLVKNDHLNALTVGELHELNDQVWELTKHPQFR